MPKLQITLKMMVASMECYLCNADKCHRDLQLESLRFFGPQQPVRRNLDALASLLLREKMQFVCDIQLS